MAEVNINTERIDDIPLLFSFLQQMGIQETLDTYANPHGNRQGLSIGWLTTAWLSYIVSESDHGMVAVESWTEKHIETLSGLYAGNPKRQTARPTTERLLKAFRYIDLSVVRLPDQTICHVTPLSELQKRILVLLGIEPSIYEGLMPFLDTG